MDGVGGHPRGEKGVSELSVQLGTWMPTETKMREPGGIVGSDVDQAGSVWDVVNPSSAESSSLFACEVGLESLLFQVSLRITVSTPQSGHMLPLL